MAAWIFLFAVACRVLLFMIVDDFCVVFLFVYDGYWVRIRIAHSAQEWNDVAMSGLVDVSVHRYQLTLSIGPRLSQCAFGNTVMPYLRYEPKHIASGVCCIDCVARWNRF